MMRLGPLVEIRCLKAACHAYIFSIPPGTPYHAYCRSCGLKWDSTAPDR
jgi:hypothetical protein